MLSSVSQYSVSPPPPYSNVSSQCSATREVGLAMKKTAHWQPKNVNGGAGGCWGYWLQSIGGFLSPFSLESFLLLSRFSYCLASKPYCIACCGNSVSWAFSSKLLISTIPSLSEPSSPSSLLSSLFSPDHLLLFVDPCASYTPRANQKREAP